MTVLHYTGHIIGTDAAPGRFPPQNESKVSSEIKSYLRLKKVGHAFGSLAAGADILVAEALLELGGKVAVYLPFSEESFLDRSVRASGGQWETRFRLVKARSIAWNLMNDRPYQGQSNVYGGCARLAMEAAIRHAEELGEAAEQLAIWDGVETGGNAGTSHDIALWRSLGFGTTIITPN